MQSVQGVTRKCFSVQTVRWPPLDQPPSLTRGDSISPDHPLCLQDVIAKMGAILRQTGDWRIPEQIHPAPLPLPHLW